jgi:hypothetical protein
MALRDAVIRAGVIPPDTADRVEKKTYSETLSRHLAIEVADSLRAQGFARIKPMREIATKGKHKGKEQIKQEKEFQGGLGPKRVDVSFSDDRHGLLLAVTIKTLNFPSFPAIKGTKPLQFDYSKPANFSKNIKNRFGDLTTESITLHLRFPFAVVGCLYVMPERSMTEKGQHMRISTFERAMHLYGTISGRRMYGDPPERFEDVTLLLHRPLVDKDKVDDVVVRLYRSGQPQEVMTEQEYYEHLRSLYNDRNPHAMVGEEPDLDEVDFEEEETDDTEQT